MKLFLDTCNVESVRNAADTGLVSGVTTNPTLAQKANRPDYRKMLAEICDISGLESVSAQVRENQTAEKMFIEGVELDSICPGKIAVKLPMNPHGLTAAKLLRRKKEINTNITLVFRPAQALLAMKADATFVSYFMGRQEAKLREKWGEDQKAPSGAQSYAEAQIQSDLEKMVGYKTRYRFGSQILAASIRNAEHVELAADCGVDVVSMPPEVFWEMFSDNLGLTKDGIERFLKDREFLT
ncbi:MAG: transaldolase family protein [Patescibacteria group bacterium]